MKPETPFAVLVQNEDEYNAIKKMLESYSYNVFPWSTADKPKHKTVLGVCDGVFRSNQEWYTGPLTIETVEEFCEKWQLDLNPTKQPVSLEQVKDAYAQNKQVKTHSSNKNPFKNWVDFIQTADIHYIDDYVDSVATRYASAITEETTAKLKKAEADVVEHVKLLKCLLNIRDLWGVPDSEPSEDNRGEYEALRSMENQIKELLTKTQHYEK